MDDLKKTKEVLIKELKDLRKQLNNQKDRKAELKHIESQFRKVQKMEAISALAGGIAHEFNNILSPILIHTEIALLDLPDDSPVRINLEEVLSAGERARELTAQLLVLSRQEEEEARPLKISPIIKEALKMFRASLPATIKIRGTINTESDMILGDPIQIHQVLTNLCLNAEQAMQEKEGELAVSLNTVRLNKKATSSIPGLDPGSYVRLSISDTGHGMKPSLQKKIFKPNFSTKKNSSGLGLTVVRDIISGCGGTITVDSTPGKGTTFDIFFPSFKEIPSETAISQTSFGGNERILVVDDDTSVINSLSEALTKIGYNVTAKTSGSDALKVFKSKSDKFDLVITDQNMPNMTGTQLAKKIMAIRPKIPIILYTGFGEIIDRETALEMGFREYIMKPVSLNHIADVIRRVLEVE